jgi:Ca2+-binding RTX toxin-like protein
LNGDDRDDTFFTQYNGVDTISGGAGIDRTMADKREGATDIITTVEGSALSSTGTLTIASLGAGSVTISQTSEQFVLDLSGLQLTLERTLVKRVWLGLARKWGSVAKNETRLPCTMIATNGTLTGGSGPDYLSGSGVLDGGDGDDTLVGGKEPTSMNGGDGNDVLRGGGESDTILGDAGNDTIYGGARSGRLDGGAGDDQIWGSTFAETIVGGSGRDRIHGNGGGDEIHALDNQRDTIWGGDGANRCTSDIGANGDRSSGVERIEPTNAWLTKTGTLMVTGNTLVNPIYLIRSGDRVLVRMNPDEIDQDTAFNRYFSGTRRIHVDAGDGDDHVENLTGLPGTILGGAGNDSIEGGSGGCILVGDSGDDTLIGGKRNDTLVGGAGHDRLIASGGDDVLIAREGEKDMLDGGTGADTARADRNRLYRDLWTDIEIFA